MIASIPGITFSIGAYARYQAVPKESHLKVAKRIICYVHEIINFDFWYPFDTTPVLAGYTDANWVDNIDDHKSTSGGCFYVGNYLVSWQSQK